VVAQHVRHVAAPLLDEDVDLFDLDLAIAMQLAELLELTLHGVGFALRAAARQLLA
jgi:hypothetical protein